MSVPDETSNVVTVAAMQELELSAPEKLKILENEYDISVDDKIREDASECVR